MHYYSHGADGVVKPTLGNRTELIYGENDFVSTKVEVRIPYVSVGSAVAGAFPAAQFTELELVGIFDACRQERALVDFRDAVLTGRSDGITAGVTISSTRAIGDANVCLAGVGIYSDAFLANLFGPSFDKIEDADDAATTTQDNVGAAPYQALGQGAIDMYDWAGSSLHLIQRRSIGLIKL